MHQQLAFGNRLAFLYSSSISMMCLLLTTLANGMLKLSSSSSPEILLVSCRATTNSRQGKYTNVAIS